MKYQQIQGQNVKSEFVILHHEWECDGYGWVTEDGRVWVTSHGGDPFEASAETIERFIDSAESCLEGLRTVYDDMKGDTMENKAIAWSVVDDEDLHKYDESELTWSPFHNNWVHRNPDLDIKLPPGSGHHPKGHHG